VASPSQERKYVESVGEAGAFTLAPAAVAPLPSGSPILDDLNTLWDPGRYATARRPVSIGRLADHQRFSSTPATRMSNVPVKVPGGEYRFPVEAACAKEALQLCIDCEHAINPAVEQCFAYLTVDRDVIQTGWAQRGLGAHADWFQGTRIEPKMAVDHGYLCADRDPAEFFAQPFHLSAEDLATDTFNEAFARQARPECGVRADPYEVLLFDAYSVHGAVPAHATAQRTFIRFFYSVAIYERPQDTRSELLDFDWAGDGHPRR
jgi:hypothetical protein